MTETRPARHAIRHRHYVWNEATHSAPLGRDRDGLAFLEAMASGEIPPPPIGSTLDFSISHVEPGRVAFKMMPAVFHLNPMGMMAGGVLATLLDSTAGCTLLSVLPAGSSYTSLDLSTKFLKPVTTETGLLTCEGKIIHLGRQIALTEAWVTRPDGTVCAHATSSQIILLRRQGAT